MAGKQSRKSESGDEYIHEVYQSFMTGYVRRINDATLRVPINGVRIGNARYSRLAQINLDSGIITFSRYAVENVPERGRRYLVLHELAHVRERGHNKKFWSLVGEHEPEFKRIGRELEEAFHRNVIEDQVKAKRGKQSPALPLIRTVESQSRNDSQVIELPFSTPRNDPGLLYPHDSGLVLPYEEYWEASESGVVCGGSDEGDPAEVDYFDHLF